MSPASRQRSIIGLMGLLLALGSSLPARAHIGSKDVFEQLQAGPYKLYVTVRTPLVIPGVATVDVRSSGEPVRSIEITPLPMIGEASRHPPTPDPMQASPTDPAFFTGSLWLMASGSWQVRITVDGAAGKATAAVPVPAMPLSVLPMQRSLGVTLAILGIILIFGMASIVAAAVRESRLPPGEAPTPARRRSAAIASGLTLALLIAAVLLGNKWWKVEAADYAKDLYKPLDLHAHLNGDVLDVSFGDFNEKKHRWESFESKDWLLDHGHLMHLYAIRQPGMDAAFHLHPALVAGTETNGVLRTALPAMPPGTYRLFADVVFRSGFPQTLTTELTVPPGLVPAPLSPEDAAAAPPPLAAGELGTRYKLPDGYTMVWDRPATITANMGYSFRFTLLDAAGKPAADMQPYLGMPGHAAWVKADGSTFAHTHPEGSAAMPAMELAQASSGSASPAPAEMKAGMGESPDMAGMGKPVVPVVEFPYGFPAPGRYRVFIQMKHAATVETGVFDAEVQ